MTPKYNLKDNVQEGTLSYMYPNLKKQKKKTTKKTETTKKQKKPKQKQRAKKWEKRVACSRSTPRLWR